ncbi:MAG: sulfurtransferase TusA family protein [Solirubrobacterales bacterium]
MEVDARGLRCPLPFLRAKLALERMQPGQTLVVHATDPESPIDLRALCTEGDHELVATDERPGAYRFVIRCR